jgi:hypothetical protein
MKISTDAEAQATQEKLALLARTVDEATRDETGTPHTRELTVRSLKRLINQLKEEVARHKAHAAGPPETS